MAMVFQHDSNSYFIGLCEDHEGPMPHGCVSPAPPARPWAKVWPKWTGKKWQMVEDHRERRTDGGFANEDLQAPTDYWLPTPASEADTYQSQARHMTTIGPLPAGAVLERPEKPLSVAQTEKMREIAAAHERALAGAVALNDPTPSTVAVESSLLAVSDSEGLEWVRDQLVIRRAELEAQVQAATSVAAVEAIAVSYSV